MILVNSNLNQRQELLPSEKAFAYKLQKESYEAKGQRKSTAAVAEQNAENIKKIQRYIKLTRLTPDLLKMVDEDRLLVTVGFDLSTFPYPTWKVFFLSVQQSKSRSFCYTITEFERI